MNGPGLTTLQQRLGYAFTDPALLSLALTHSSASPVNYERLEHLGDAVLELAVTHWLYQDFPQFGPGQLSILRAELVCAKTLAQLARELDLPQVLRLSRPAAARGLHQRPGVLSEALEAVLGALFLDAGSRLPPVERVVRALCAPQAHAVICSNPQFYQLPPPRESGPPFTAGGCASRGGLAAPDSRATRGSYLTEEVFDESVCIR